MKQIIVFIFLTLYLINCDGKTTVASPPPSEPMNVVGEWIGKSYLQNTQPDCSGEWINSNFSFNIGCTGFILDSDGSVTESCEQTNEGTWGINSSNGEIFYQINHVEFGVIDFYTTNSEELVMNVEFYNPVDNTNYYCLQQTFEQGILNCQECNPSSCASGVFDCHGVCDGSAVEDCTGECGGTAQTDCTGECGGTAQLDCLGVCNGSAAEDCLGVCNGDAIEDVCGVCEGSQTNASECIGNGKYALTEIRYYSSNNCSGSPIETLYGPAFYFDETASYYTDECNYYNDTGGETITLTFDFDGDEYAVIYTENEDELDQMCDDYGGCNNSAECDQCSSYDKDIYQINIEAGTFDKQNSTLTFSPNAELSYRYGTRINNHTYCGEPYSDIYMYDGCLWYYEWYGNSTYDRQYLEQGSRMILTNTEHAQSNGGDCPEGYVTDCSGDGDCCPEYYIGDGYCDGGSECYGCNLTCYDNDGGDCLDYDEYCASYDTVRCIEYELNFINNFTLGGCTDETAASYNPYATYDDGSCGAGLCYDDINQNNMGRERIPANKFEKLIKRYPEKRRIVK